MGDSSYLNLSDFTLLASVIAILCKLSNFQIFLGTLLFVLWINVRIILILFLIIDRLTEELLLNLMTCLYLVNFVEMIPQ